MNTVLKKMDGKKTWTGLALILIPILLKRLGIEFVEADLQTFVYNFMHSIGFVVTCYGNWHAHKKLED
jgi:hypothetical protein